MKRTLVSTKLDDSAVLRIDHLAEMIQSTRSHVLRMAVMIGIARIEENAILLDEQTPPALQAPVSKENHA